MTTAATLQRLGLASINREQRLYVIPAGKGYVSCLGFDVLHKRTGMIAGWMGRPDLAPPPRKGTLKAWKAYKAAMGAAESRWKATGERCPAELTPQLIGLEGRRVEVVSKSGDYKHRFTVGKSTGWMPCHLEIANSRSTGGGAAYVPEGATVRVVG